MRITKVEAVYLEKPLKERFWTANSPIGGYTDELVYPRTSNRIPVVASISFRDNDSTQSSHGPLPILRPSREVAGPEPPQALDPNGRQA
jgi:hypothetical protein